VDAAVGENAEPRGGLGRGTLPMVVLYVNPLRLVSYSNITKLIRTGASPCNSAQVGEMKICVDLQYGSVGTASSRSSTPPLED